MLSHITFAEMPAGSVVYNRCTRLFPFSPRREIDWNLVQRLKRSIAETGMWQPVVVRAGTLEGIAGNHRFLACLELAQEKGMNPAELIPAVLVECDEGLAVSIGLMENDLRENLTRWETVRALLQAAERKPEVVETVFEVDGATIEQLRLWDKELDYDAEAEERRRTLQARLTRDWTALINERLSEYPQLHAKFMEQLRHPAWVQAQSLDEFGRAITRDLLSHGVRFEMGKTWNDVPTHKCLGCQMTFEDLQAALQRETAPIALQTNGTSRCSCRYLRLFPRYTQQFVPGVDGASVLEVGRNDAGHYPPGAFGPDGQAVRGDAASLFDGLDAYCVAPDVREPDSCFHLQEAEAAQEAVQALRQQKLPAALPNFIQERQDAQEYIWEHPQMQGEPCTPKTCRHAQDTPPGCAVILQPGGVQKMACLHAECGGAAQEALIDWEARQRQLDQQRQQAAVDTLRQMSAQRTLLALPGKVLDLSTRALLEAIEPVLVPEWDTPTMFHIVLGWQAVAQAQMAVELGVLSPASELAQAFRGRYGDLAQKPTSNTIVPMFTALRAQVVQSDEGLRRWVTCLALVRTWRDEVETIEQIEQATRRVSSYE
ncbi:MAG: ParB N-terminal domain-containing protein [Thermoflexales bacterium]|nr:ParB N-terminal domain-containing protein [Thermoflexales bacterium]